MFLGMYTSLQWRHNELDGVSNHRCLHCLLDCWFRRRSKKTSKLRVTGLCARNSPVTDEFHIQKASFAENVSIWWRHHVVCVYDGFGKIYLVEMMIYRFYLTKYIFPQMATGSLALLSVPNWGDISHEWNIHSVQYITNILSIAFDADSKPMQRQIT